MPEKDPRVEVIRKALTDPAFKAELLKNPAAAVEKATGIKIPAGTAIKVVEDTASVVHLVLPAASSGELSEESLRKVAGGAIQRSCYGECTNPGKSRAPLDRPERD